MNHESLREWLSANNLYFKDLAKEVGMTTLSTYTRGEGRPFPPEFIQHWADVYDWTDRQIFLFQYERPFREAIPSEEKKSVADLMREIADRMEEVR